MGKSTPCTNISFWLHNHPLNPVISTIYRAKLLICNVAVIETPYPIQ